MFKLYTFINVYPSSPRLMTSFFVTFWVFQVSGHPSYGWEH